MTQEHPAHPVFIVGQARSGTSILYRLVLEHPSFRGPGEANLAESHVMQVIADQASVDSVSTRQFAGLDDEGWHRLLHELQSLRRRRRLAAALPTGLLRRSVPVWRALGGTMTLRTYVEHAQAGRQVARLVEKTPWHLPWARHLWATFPDARLLAITRDPVDAYASYRRRSADDPDGGWAAVPIDTFIDRWSDEARRILELRGDARFLDIDYAELVERPRETQEQIFTWLGEAPRTELPATVAINPNAPVSDATALFGPIRSIPRDRSAYLTDREIDRITDRLGSLTDALHGAGRRPR